MHANDRRRVVRALELAEAGSSLAPEQDRLWAGELRHPTVLVGLDVPKAELERRIETRTREMFAAGVEDEVRRALAEPISTTARKTMGLDEIAKLPRDEAVAAIVDADAPLRGVPAEVDAAPRGSLWSLPTARRARSPMRSSRWHAHGNVYLVAEAAALTPEHVREDAKGTDGIIEVVRARRRSGRDRDLESGRLEGRAVGQRDAHRRALADGDGGTGEARVDVRGGRSVEARRLPDGSIEPDLGAVDVGPRETVAGVELTPVSSAIRTPSSSETRPRSPRIGPLLETHARFPNRTNVQVARVDAPGEVTARVWERGVGETTLVGNERGRRRAATHGEGSVVVHFPGGDLLRAPGGRPRLAHRPGRAVADPPTAPDAAPSGS